MCDKANSNLMTQEKRNIGAQKGDRTINESQWTKGEGKGEGEGENKKKKKKAKKKTKNKNKTKK